MKKIKEDFFYLPVKNNAPDYDYMETYVKALQKNIIENIIKYADGKFL